MPSKQRGGKTKSMFNIERINVKWKTTKRRLKFIEQYDWITIALLHVCALPHCQNFISKLHVDAWDIVHAILLPIYALIGHYFCVHQTELYQERWMLVHTLSLYPEYFCWVSDNVGCTCNWWLQSVYFLQFLCAAKQTSNFSTVSKDYCYR